MRRTYIVLIAVLMLSGGACSKSSSGTSPTTTTSLAAGCTDATATDLSADDPFTVVIVNFAFQPSCFKAKSTSSITVENQGTFTHTFTIIDTQVDVSIDAGQTFNGESAGLAPGTYQFHCRIHSQMTGTVIVV
jgi:plastocyanin